jgi:IS30 family transposase
MLSALKQQGLNQSEIARSLGRHRSTISRELQRNSSRWDSAYRPSKAQERTNGRRSRSRRNQRFDRRDWTRVKALLRQQWSPEQVSESLRKSGELSISHETIYRYIWRDRWAGGFLYRDLRQVTKSRRKRYSAYDSRGRLAGKRHISERPQSVEHRNRIGHWEIDTVVGGGSKDCVVTLVERKTGYVFVGKLRDRSMFEMTRRLKKLIARAPEKFKTITSDQRERVPRLRIRRGRHGCEVLLRDSLPLLGARQQRELQRAAAPVPSKESLSGEGHAARLRCDCKETEHEAPEETRLSNAGGVLQWKLINVAVQA